MELDVKMCDYCCKENDCRLCFNAGDYIACQDSGGETCEYFQKMNFCPMCGKSLK